VFDALEITTAPKANKIDYSFEVSSRGEKGTAREARLVLSDGQLTATAIGLFFAFSDAETHNVDLLYVDDPTQNLDLPCKQAMAKVVAELAQRRQVVVSTQDEDFVSFLESEGFFDLAAVYHLERWDGNPIIKARKARAGQRGR
jgi:predicted ATPase